MEGWKMTYPCLKTLVQLRVYEWKPERAHINYRFTKLNTHRVINIEGNHKHSPNIILSLTRSKDSNKNAKQARTKLKNLPETHPNLVQVGEF